MEKETRFQDHLFWIRILVLSLISYVILYKLLTYIYRVVIRMKENL